MVFRFIGGVVDYFLVRRRWGLGHVAAQARLGTVLVLGCGVRGEGRGRVTGDNGRKR